MNEYYKALSIPEKEWVYGLPSYNIYGKIDSIWQNPILCKCESRKKIITETLCQSIGLIDKNGKLLFENDIVKTKYGRLCYIEKTYIQITQDWI